MRMDALIKAFANKRVLVVGDLILDSFIWGRVSRISPEAPVPVVDVVEKSYALGGATNVANNIVSLGGRATVMGIVGQDGPAARMRTLMEERAIDYELIESPRPTTVKTRVIAHSQQVVRFDQEDRSRLSGKALKDMLLMVGKEAARHDAVIISDYKKGVITAELIRTVLKAAGRNRFVSLDPKVGHFHLYKGLSLMTPNLSEASQGSGIEITDEASLVRAARKLLAKHSLGALLITRGEDGMTLFLKSGLVHIPTMAKHVYDVTGAGDTVIATFTLAVAAGASLEDAAVLSNHAGGIVVGEVGTASTTPAALLKSLKANKPAIVRKAF